MGGIVSIQTGRAGRTAVAYSADNAQTLEQAGVLAVGQAVDGALITCEDFDIRYAFGGVVPTQAGLGHILAAEDYLYLSNGYDVRSFMFINADNGDDAILQVTTVKVV